MTKKKSETIQNNSAPAQVDTAAEVLVTEVAQATSQSITTTAVEAVLDSDNQEEFPLVGDVSGVSLAETQNTSTPALPVNLADVLATAGEQSPAPADAGTLRADGAVENSPLVGAVSGDNTGEKLSELLAESMTVTSQIDGFRRGGIAWSRTPTTIALDDLSEEQIVAIAGEPMLDVVFNTAPAAD